jgi:hypothetical protein
MSKGGFRAQAGRLKGGKNMPKGPRPVYLRIPDDLAKAARLSGVGPDVFLWMLMNDENADMSYCFRAAGLLLPFHCAKPADARVGKKDEAERCRQLRLNGGASK